MDATTDRPTAPLAPAPDRVPTVDLARTVDPDSATDPAPTGDPAPAPGPSPAFDPAPTLDPRVAALLRRDGAGLVCAVVVDDATEQVLMVAWMDDDALARTLTSGRAWYFSRSRGEPWRKGDTSGHVQHVVSAALDCDGDALVLRVRQHGPACHTGDATCFDARPLPVTGGRA